MRTSRLDMTELMEVTEETVLHRETEKRSRATASYPPTNHESQSQIKKGRESVRLAATERIAWSCGA